MTFAQNWYTLVAKILYNTQIILVANRSWRLSSCKHCHLNKPSIPNITNNCYKSVHRGIIKKAFKQDLSNQINHYTRLLCQRLCNKFAKPISGSLRHCNTATFEEMSQRWRTVGNKVPDLTGQRFETQNSRSRDERVTARPTAEFIAFEINRLKENR